ncbi:hypothetical protein F5883DRAFT_545047 [Diaporthe sp. PMI_573]|nr:hypothetical protein F5883DRAFT_545047 [Diaporthaceae sp. PMI_573]
MDECNAQQSCSHSGLTSTTSASKNRRRGSDDLVLHEDPELGFSLERTSSDTPPPRVKFLLSAASRVEGGLRTNVAYPSPGRSGMTSRVQKARFTSPTTRPSTHDCSSQQETFIGPEAKESEDETYIFSDNYVLPPPRDSFGEGSVILPHVPNEGHLPRNPDTSAVHKSSKISVSSPKNNDQLMKSQSDSERQGFEPDFFDEFRDLVEFI